MVPVVKPQVAFFERMGSAGLAALEEVLAACRDAGLLVIADAKRGDIGSTMAAYAAAWLDPASPLAADAMTAVAYLGLGALQPALDLAPPAGRGVIVVARSSNPEGRSLQDGRPPTAAGPAGRGHAAGRDRRPQPRRAPGARARWGGGRCHAGPFGFDLAGLGGVILAPGSGVQGGTAEARGRLFAGCPPGTVLPERVAVAAGGRSRRGRPAEAAARRVRRPRPGAG